MSAWGCCRAQCGAVLVAGLAVCGGAMADPVKVGGPRIDDGPRVGWHFYVDPEPLEPVTPPQTPALSPRTAVVPAPRVRSPELVGFAVMQKQMEELRNIAIMVPSETNVRRYMEYEHMVGAKASLFADVAQRVAWKNPELDMARQGRPANGAALAVYDQQQANERTTRLTELGKDHVLMFFFRSDCPYCHTFAPTVAQFGAKYGLKIMPVSLDGVGLPEFPNPRSNNGIAGTLGVQQVPALFLAQPYTGDIAPVGYGVLSAVALEERIAAVSDKAADPTRKVVPIVAGTTPIP